VPSPGSACALSSASHGIVWFESDVSRLERDVSSLERDASRLVDFHLSCKSLKRRYDEALLGFKPECSPGDISRGAAWRAIVIGRQHPNQSNDLNHTNKQSSLSLLLSLSLSRVIKDGKGISLRPEHLCIRALD
jgi:hypothetical protein